MSTYLISFQKDDFSDTYDRKRYIMRGFIVLSLDVTKPAVELEEKIRDAIRKKYFENDETDFGISLIQRLDD